MQSSPTSRPAASASDTRPPIKLKRGSVACKRSVPPSTHTPHTPSNALQMPPPPQQVCPRERRPALRELQRRRRCSRRRVVRARLRDPRLCRVLRGTDAVCSRGGARTLPTARRVAVALCGAARRCFACPNAHLIVAQFRRKRLKLADRPERRAGSRCAALRLSIRPLPLRLTTRHPKSPHRPEDRVRVCANLASVSDS